MKSDGHDPDVWLANVDRRTTAPDGRPDVHLVRNSIDPNAGWILFRDRSGKAENPGRIVQIALKGDRLECQVVIPK